MTNERQMSRSGVTSDGSPKNAAMSGAARATSAPSETLTMMFVQ